jgi:hypothetical protein
MGLFQETEDGNFYSKITHHQYGERRLPRNNGVKHTAWGCSKRQKTEIFTVKLPITNMETGGYPETMVSNTLHEAPSRDGRRKFLQSNYSSRIWRQEVTQKHWCQTHCMRPLQETEGENF